MLTDKVKQTIKKYRLIARNDTIVVGVSGGPDSVALLEVLNGLKKEFNLTLHAAHLDHMLRKDSGADLAFVRDLARKLKIPVACERINVKKLAKRGSLEEIARNARLGFLFRVARQAKADSIALGHTLDDQAETVLMRIIRGAGLYGLSAILPLRRLAGYRVIRPLIEVKRKEIESYLKKKKVSPRRDASNSEDIYLRNRIRRNLIPFIEKAYNKNIKEVLSHMAQSVADDYDYINRQALRNMNYFRGTIDLNRFRKLHPALQKIILRLSIARLKGDTRAIAFKHIQEIEDLVLNRPPDSIVDLPKNISVIKKKKCLSFYRRKR
jgi:tRNA(Ile)-lysidine synthase